jgi:hypothetical protein
MKPTRRRRFATVLATLLLFLATAITVTAPSAAAEEDCYANGSSGYFVGGQNGYFLPCDNGDDPHLFYDNNSDSDPTSLHLWDCSSNPDIDLFFYVSSGVDQGWHKVGTTKRFWCLNTDGGWKTWGRQTRVGWYAFSIANHRGTGPLSGWMHAGW